MTKKLILYQFEECPYCQKVRDYLDDKKISYEKVNVARDREDDTRKMLFEKTGVHSVPVIDIDGEFIGDSSAIIAHFEKA